MPAYPTTLAEVRSADNSRLELVRQGPGPSVDIVAINYFPEVTGIAPYVTDVAKHLSRHGWNVRVITGYPHYPQWELQGDPDDFATTCVMDGVIVVRVRHSVPAKTSLPTRGRMEMEFGRRVLSSHLRPDAAVVLVSPPLIASAMIVMAKRFRHHRRPIGVWVHDLYSQAVSETGAGHALTVQAVRMLESLVLRNADGIAVVHDRFGDIARRSLGVRDDRITVMRNWNQARLPERASVSRARRELGMPADAVLAVHAGNMGMKQGLDNIVEAARLADQRGSDVRFLLVGDGNQRARLEELARGITSIEFIDPLPDREFHLMLSAADVLLVNELPGVGEMSIPSKLTTYFGIGVPVVAAVATDGITAQEVRRSGAGDVVPGGDPAALLAAVDALIADPARASRYGVAGLSYSQTMLGSDAAMNRFEEWVSNLADHRRPAMMAGAMR